MVRYFEENHFQVFYAAPPEKINSIGQFIDSTVSLIVTGRYTNAVEGLVKQDVYKRQVIRMVGKGLGISMMSELMIRGNTEDVYCVPVSPTCIREIGMGMKPGTEENGSIAKLRECVMQFVSTLNKGGNVSLK